MSDRDTKILTVGDPVTFKRRERKHCGTVLFFGVDLVVVEDIKPPIGDAEAVAVPTARITRIY
jgi:hypothetical protein